LDQIKILLIFRFSGRKATLKDMFKLQIVSTFWKITIIFMQKIVGVKTIPFGMKWLKL